MRMTKQEYYQGLLNIFKLKNQDIVQISNKGKYKVVKTKQETMYLQNIDDIGDSLPIDLLVYHEYFVL